MRRSNLLFPFLAVLGCAALTAAPSTARGDGGGGSGGAPGTGGSASTGGGAGTGGGASTGAGGAGGNPIKCVADGLCETPSEDCTCADCEPLALCHPGQCVPDGVCDLKDACTCADCAFDGFCNDPSHCVDDGTCDTFSEGCGCVDCMARPECAGGSTTTGSTSATSSSASGSGGAGGGGGEGSGFVPSDEPSGCALGPAPGAPIPVLGLVVGLAALALGARRARR